MRYIYIASQAVLFKPQLVPVVTIMLTPFAQHGGVRYVNTVIQLTNRIGQRVVASRCLHTADSCSRHCIRSFPSDKMFAGSRFVVAT